MSKQILIVLGLILVAQAYHHDMNPEEEERMFLAMGVDPNPEPRVLVAVGDVTKPTSNIKLGSQINVYFEFTTNNSVAVINAVIECNVANSFFAIGFGQTVMANSDIWGFAISGSTVTATDYKASGQTAPTADTSAGGANNLILLGYDVQTTKTLVKVQRALSTGDANDVTIAQGSMNNIWMYRSGNGALGQHTTSTRGAVSGKSWTTGVNENGAGVLQLSALAMIAAIFAFFF